jgi:hypothetical protein
MGLACAQRLVDTVVALLLVDVDEASATAAKELAAAHRPGRDEPCPPVGCGNSFMQLAGTHAGARLPSPFREVTGLLVGVIERVQAEQPRSSPNAGCQWNAR